MGLTLPILWDYHPRLGKSWLHDQQATNLNFEDLIGLKD